MVVFVNYGLVCNEGQSVSGCFLCIHCSESEESEKLRTQTLDPTSTLNNVSNQDTKPSVERFFPVMSPATPPAESPCVRVDGISASWSYEREKLVLSNICDE